MRDRLTGFQTKTKVMLGVLAAVVISSGATIGVMAAIPNSGSGTISACRTKITGSLRVIDAQSGAKCSRIETALSWPSQSSQTPQIPQTAVARIIPDTANSTNRGGMLDVANSRNITKYHTVTQQIGEESFIIRICIKLSFNPKVVMFDAASGMTTNNINTAGLNTDLASIKNGCGEGGHNVMFETPSITPSTLYFTE